MLRRLQHATSLRTRLLVSATAILLLFILLTALALDRALDAYTRHAEFDRLQGLIYSLLGAADIDTDGTVSVALNRIPAPRLQQPDSGLFAAIFTADGRLIWQSPSALKLTCLLHPDSCIPHMSIIVFLSHRHQQRNVILVLLVPD